MNITTDIIGRKVDLGTPELHKREEVINVESSETRHRARVVTEWPLLYYLHREWISPEQYDAAELLYLRWYYGAQKAGQPRIVDLMRIPGLGSASRQQELEIEYKEAMRAINRLPVRLVIYNVVCLHEWAGYLKNTYQRKKRMQMLGEGLSDLVKHFQLT